MASIICGGCMLIAFYHYVRSDLSREDGDKAESERLFRWAAAFFLASMLSIPFVD